MRQSKHRVFPLLSALGLLSFGLVSTPSPTFGEAMMTSRKPPITDDGRNEDRESKRERKKGAKGRRLEIKGTVRARFEALENYTIKKFGTGTHDGFLLWRTRLNLAYRLDRGRRIYVQLQDNRFTESELSASDFPASCPYQNFLDLRQAFFEQRPLHRGAWGVRLGRQAIAYRDNRIFGPGDWGNTGRYTWDAVKLTRRTGHYGVDVFAAKRIEYDPRHFDDEHYPYRVYAAYAQSGKKDQARDLFYVYKLDDHNTTAGESGTGSLRRHTVGTHMRRKSGCYDYGGTAAYQFGDHGADSIRAYGYHLGFGKTMLGPRKLRLGLDYTVASGDSDPTDGKTETFDGVFGAIDKYYGRMNVVSWMNVEDLQLSISMVPRKGWTTGLDLHWFHLAEDRDAWYYCNGKPVKRDKSGSSGNYIGREVDIIIKYVASKRFEIMAGRAHFSPGTFPTNQGICRGADWTFLQTTWRF